MRYLILLAFIGAFSAARGNGVTLQSSNQSIAGTWQETWATFEDPNVTGEMDGVWGTTGNTFTPISDSVTSQPFSFSTESATLAPLGYSISGSALPTGILATADGFPPSNVSGFTDLEDTTTTTFTASGPQLFVHYTLTGSLLFSEDFSGTATLTDLTTSTTLFTILEVQTVANEPIDMSFVFNSDPSHLYQLDYHEFLKSFDDSDSQITVLTTLDSAPGPNSAPDHAATLGLFAFSCLGLMALRRTQRGRISKRPAA